MTPQTFTLLIFFFLNITTSFNLKQYVRGQTHNRYNTLDLVFTQSVRVPTVESLVYLTINA